jgi:integrase
VGSLLATCDPDQRDCANCRAGAWGFHSIQEPGRRAGGAAAHSSTLASSNPIGEPHRSRRRQQIMWRGCRAVFCPFIQLNPAFCVALAVSWVNASRRATSSVMFVEGEERYVVHRGLAWSSEVRSIDLDEVHLCQKVNLGAESCKTVLSLLLGLAVRHGAIKTNPVRDVAKVKRGKRKERPRALTVLEADEAISKARTDPQAALQDVVDLMEFMFGTGLRIGEALGLAENAVDLETGTLEVCQIAVRLSGQGTVLQPRPKTDAGWRIIALPPNVVELCRRRIAAIDNPERLLFPGLKGGVRNPSNANRDMKAAMVRANPDLSWVTSHTCRKTVATRLDEAGLSAREIADHLGHAKPSMTQDVYMGRGVASAAAAMALQREAA